MNNMELNGELLVAAHNEWMNQLCMRCVPHFVEGLHDIRKEARDKSSSKSRAAIDRETLDILKAIPEWNTHLVAERTHKIRCKVAKLQNYVTIIFMIKSKIMSCMAPRGVDVEIQLEMPKDTDFVHGVYRKIATLLETRMRLFTMFEDNAEEALDVPDVSLLHSILARCVDLAISMEVPSDDISQTFLGDTSDISVKYKATPLATPAAPSTHQEMSQTPSTPSALPTIKKKKNRVQDEEEDFFTPRDSKKSQSTRKTESESETETKAERKTETETESPESKDSKPDATGDDDDDHEESGTDYTTDTEDVTTEDDEETKEDDTKTITIEDVVHYHKRR